MTFDLGTIALCCGLAVLYAALLPSAWRGWALYILSLTAVYLLQPPLPIRFSDFILPTATLVLTAALWWFTRADDQRLSREDSVALGLLLAVIVGLSLNRFLDIDTRITPSRPPDPLLLMLGLVLFGLTVAAVQIAFRKSWRLRFALLLLVVGFIILKAEPIGIALSGAWRAATGQDTTLAALSDLNWLGFSYIAFRLIHTVRDRQSGLLPVLSLREYITYVVFFPALIAGPIDRAERFSEDLRALSEKVGLDAVRFADGLGRITMGVFKKFVIADTLAQGMALTPVNALQAESTIGLWALLYGYALRLFFDFSGYSDIAIGVGILFGIRLPENFDRPYLKTNITAFWQSWHMTLSSWARFYVFSPLSRALLMRQPKPSSTAIVLMTQMATMITIGLWHGITVNFLIWGIWHGAGLFVHKQWSDRTRKWYRGLGGKLSQKRAWTIFAWLVTFHYVVIGWVWFALPDFDGAVRVLRGLMGMGL